MLERVRDAELLARLAGPPEGTKPAAAAIPPPGIYWLKSTNCGAFRVNRDGTKTTRLIGDTWHIDTWDLPSDYSRGWYIANITDDRGTHDIIASDEGLSWETRWEVVVEVGPRIEPPV